MTRSDSVAAHSNIVGSGAYGLAGASNTAGLSYDGL